MTVNTKQAERRELTIGNLEELGAELDRIEAAHVAGTLSTTGNWSAGQIFEHVAALMGGAVDGFPGGPAPLPVRVMCKLLFKKKAIRGGVPPAGFKLPESASFLIPGDDTTFEEGMAKLRGVVGRIVGGERFSHDSPIFGKLTHDQWVKLQCGHASLHLSFIQPDGAGSGAGA